MTQKFSLSNFTLNVKQSPTAQLFCTPLFSLNRSRWADWVIEWPCTSFCLSGCFRHWVQYLRPLIGPEITLSVPGLSMVFPPSLPPSLPPFETRKLGHSELGNFCFCIGFTICIGQEIQCLPYAGFVNSVS